MEKKRTLFVMNSSCGGSERVALIYAKLLCRLGYECKVVFLHHADTEDFAMKSFIPENISWKLLKGKARYTPLRLLREIRLFKPDIVFGTVVPISLLLLVYKSLHLNSSKVVVRMNTRPARISKMQSRMARRLFPTADVVISQTEEMKEELHRYYKIPLNSITTIHNPIDKSLIEEKIKDPNPLDAHFFHYVAIGRIQPVKGYDTLICSFAKVHGMNENARLHIVGGGSDEAYIRQVKDMAKALGVNDCVSFEGFQSNPYKYLYYADAFVLSSNIEGLPNVLLDAIYLGVPVVATRCTPFVDTVVAVGINGYTCEPKDVEGLAEKMMQVTAIPRQPAFQDPTHSEGNIIELFQRIEQRELRRNSAANLEQSSAYIGYAESRDTKSNENGQQS